ncbi:response regulator [Streptomyces sp. NPDC051909]|uniref:response regulator transcription factor n=1 Tax=Streptomyces sp. NPDC051909 TaxID=3154944 RepID=UPI003442AFB9
MTTRILIVDDQAEMRAGIKAMLRLDPGLVVAGDLSDGLQVAPSLRDHPVDLVLMDIRMPGIDVSKPPAGSARSTHPRRHG